MSGISNESRGNENSRFVDANQTGTRSTAAQSLADRIQFAEEIFHDVNNLLVVMYYSCHQLLEDMPTDDLNRTQIAIIDNARSDAVELIRKYAFRNHAQTKVWANVDLNDLIRQVESQLRPLASENLILSICLTDQPTLVSVNPDALSRLLYYLILRAMNNVLSGGWVMIETGAEPIPSAIGLEESTLGIGCQIRLIISDTGGETWNQNNPVSASVDSATSISAGPPSDRSQIPAFIKQFVSQNRGRIEQTRFQDSGTRVEITFAAGDIELENPSARSDRSETLRGSETILLVEDDPQLRKLIRSTLVSHGYQVIEAESSSTAVAKAFEHADQLHLLVTDLRIPGISGQELAAKLRDEYPGLRALFISGGLDLEVMTDPDTSGPSRFLPKPFRAEDLLTNVRELLDSSN